jgi:hexokinase
MSALEAYTIPNSPAASDPVAAIRHSITKDLGIDDSLVTDADCIAVARVSEIVGTRGCRLSACALAAVVKQTDNDKSDTKVFAGLDGSLVQFYPRFEERVRAALREVLGEETEKRIEMGLARDGSGIGGERAVSLLILLPTRQLIV